MAKTLTPPEALHRAAALCSSSEHCIADIREKLSRWGIGEPDARTIVERLVQERFIDEEQRAAARWRASGGVSVLAMSYGFYSRNESIFLIQVFDDSDVLVSRCFQHAGTCFALCLVDFEVELASGG